MGGLFLLERMLVFFAVLNTEIEIPKEILHRRLSPAPSENSSSDSGIPIFYKLETTINSYFLYFEKYNTYYILSFRMHLRDQ